MGIAPVRWWRAGAGAVTLPSQPSTDRSVWRISTLDRPVWYCQVMSTTTRTGSARERLLEAAEELFYEEGVHTVGIDRVIERAGVAKASLYAAFGSKDELVRSYLVARHEARRARIEERLSHYRSPRERLLGVFDAMAESFAEPGFRGCAFVRASAEVRPGSSVKG